MRDYERLVQMYIHKTKEGKRCGELKEGFTTNRRQLDK